MITNASELAYSAADYIAEHGWCQGDLQTPDGRVCLEGAVRMVAFGHTAVIIDGDPFYSDSRMLTLWQHLQSVLRQDYPGDRCLGPVAWNDEIAASQEDVILFLKRAGNDLAES